MARGRKTRLVTKLAAPLAFVALFAAAREAEAQGVAVGTARNPREEASAEERDVPRRGTLRGMFGVPVAERLLLSGEADDRQRGVSRLAAIGTPEAIDALVDALEQSSVVGRDGRARLTAVRFLATHAGRENVRPLLIREISEAGPEGRAAQAPLSALTRAAAALSLAESGDKKAFGALLSAVLQGGAGGEAAASALAEHPPVSLAALFEGRRRIEPALAALLADIGDVRAIDKLRATLDEADPAYRAAAALALAKLGDASGANLARTWVKSEDTRLLRVGAEVLVRVSDKGAAEAITTLLGASATRIEGLRLALLAPSESLIHPLVAALPLLPEGELDKALAAIGRCGGAAAAEALLKALAKPEHATSAAFALARLAGKPGHDALSRALASVSAKPGAPRRLITRAAVLRVIVLGDEPNGLGAALEALAKSQDPSDHAVSSFGRVATGRVGVRAALDEACSSKTPCELAIVAAVARASLLRGAEGLRELLPLLRTEVSGEEPPPLVVAAGVALLADPRAEGVPTSVLLRFAEGGGPLAPLAARALPSRDDEALRGRITRLLGGTDPVVRAHVALGLAFDPEPDAVTLLVNAYRFEEDAAVRRAVIRALSDRHEPQRNATLVVARDLDPDGDVRALARAALAGRSLAPVVLSGSREAVWVSLVANAEASLPSVKGRPGRLVRGDGLALPVVSDPDGVVLVPGLPEGRSSLTLAPEPNPRDAPAP